MTDSVDDHIAFVNSMASNFRATKNNSLATAETRARYASWWERAVNLTSFLEEQKRLLAPLPTEVGDTSDLPAELLAELTAPVADPLESQILMVMRAFGPEVQVDLDQILIGLFRKFTVIQKRRFLQNKMWRMAKKKMVFGIQGKRGAYALKEPKPDRSDPDDEIPF